MEFSSLNQIRNNLKYTLFLSITIILRYTVLELMNCLCRFPKILTSFLMFGGEFFFGLIYYIFHLKILSPKKKPKFMGIPLIIGVVKKKDSTTKIIFYIIVAALLDFTHFVTLNYLLLLINKDDFKNSFLAIRLKPIQIIFSSIICFFCFKTAIYLHHILSLVLTILSLVGVFFAEIFFAERYNIGILEIFAIILSSFLIKSIADCFEKYLMDINFCSQFKLLFIEGASGIIFTIIFFILAKYLNFQQIVSSNSKDIIILIILSIAHFILSGFLNVYRLTVIMKLSPMNRTTSDSFANAFIIIYSIFFKDIKNNDDYYWKIINTLAAFIIIFCCLIYNEILILRFCGLERNIYTEIAERSSSESSNNSEYEKTTSIDTFYSVESENND